MKGIVEAHLKAENQNWAGTVIYSTIVNDLLMQNNLGVLEKVALKYQVPYKTGSIEKEYVFKIKTGKSNAVILKNLLEDIERIFSSDNKNIEIQGVKQKLVNTKKFIIDTNDVE